MFIMANCNEHPGFIPVPEDRLERGINHQLTREIIGDDADLQAIFDERINQLTFSDFFNECFVHLSDGDLGYLPVLREASEMLFMHLRKHAHPYNCGHCTIAGGESVEKGLVASGYGDFKLVFIQGGAYHDGSTHAWIELLEHKELPEDRLIERFFSLKRLVIDFSGLSPQKRDISNVRHNTYTPFFGSPELSHTNLKRKYLGRTEPMIVHQLTKVGFATYYVRGSEPRTQKFSLMGILSSS